MSNDFVRYSYVPQFAEGSAPVGQGAVGSGEGAGSSIRGPFSLLTGDTSSGLEHVGWIDNAGKITQAPTVGPGAETRSYAVLEKFLCIPGDGALATMSIVVMSKVPQGSQYVEAPVFPFRFVDDDNVAAALSISVMQIDRSNRRASPEAQDQHVLFGPEKFAMCDHKITRMRPSESIRPGLPMYLRVVSVLTSAVSSWSSDDIYEGRPPTYAFKPVAERFSIRYSIPISVSRVAK